jgi:cobalt/nickel transport protein
MSKRITLISLVLILILGICISASAHFQLILPTDETIDVGENEEIGIQLIFTHPMEASHSMDMDIPVKFGVLNKGRETSLVDQLESFTFDGARSWKMTYKTKSPGDYVFYLDPCPLQKLHTGQAGNHIKL